MAQSSLEVLSLDVLINKIILKTNFSHVLNFPALKIKKLALVGKIL